MIEKSEEDTIVTPATEKSTCVVFILLGLRIMDYTHYIINSVCKNGKLLYRLQPYIYYKNSNNRYFHIILISMDECIPDLA